MSLYLEPKQVERLIAAAEKIADALTRQAAATERAMEATVPMLELSTRQLQQLDNERTGHDTFGT